MSHRWSFPAWTLYSPLIAGQHFQRKGERMSFMGSEVLRTVLLCMWAREAGENMLGTATVHKTNFIIGILFLWHYILTSSFTWAFQGQYERAGPIFNVIFLTESSFFAMFVWLGFFVVQGLGLFCFVHTDEINTLLFSLPSPPATRDFPKHNRYLMTLELNKLLNL